MGSVGDSGVNVSTPVGTLEIADDIISTITQPLESHVLIGLAQIAGNTSFYDNLLFGDPQLDWGSGQFRPSGRSRRRRHRSRLIRSL